MKAIVAAEDDAILGFVIVGPDAARNATAGLAAMAR
jgi:pyruvate/2-oxoglutarate dehydrogenase complex dihydrolipoamide dehydrogenase (E3) component